MTILRLEGEIVNCFHLCKGHCDVKLCYRCDYCKIDETNDKCFFYKDSGKMVYDIHPVAIRKDTTRFLGGNQK